MTLDDLDRALRGDEPIAPSSGFAAAVRAAVAEDAAAPPPLRFPWLRLALGMAACLVVAAAGTLLAVSAAAPLAVGMRALEPLLQPLGYAGLALVLSLALLRLPVLLMRRF